MVAPGLRPDTSEPPAYPNCDPSPRECRISALPIVNASVPVWSPLMMIGLRVRIQLPPAVSRTHLELGQNDGHRQRGSLLRQLARLMNIRRRREVRSAPQSISG